MGRNKSTRPEAALGPAGGKGRSAPRAAMPAAVADLLLFALEHPGSLCQTADMLVRKILDLTGARLTVLVLEGAAQKGEEAVTILAVQPTRHLPLAEAQPVRRMVREAPLAKRAAVIPLPADAAEAGRAAGTELAPCLVLPLRCGVEQVGAVLCFGMTDAGLLDSVLAIANVLSRAVCVVVKNALLVERQTRTREALKREIAERQQAEAGLSESEKRYRSLVESTSDWVWEIDTGGRYTYCSPKVADLLGYEPSEVIGKSPFDFIAPEARQEVAAKFRRYIPEHRPFSGLENLNVHRDGRTVMLETSGVPIFDPQGAFAGYRGIDRDISARRAGDMKLRESEARFRTMADVAWEGLLIHRAGIIADSNRALGAMLGYGPEEIVGSSLLDLLAPETRERAAERLRTELDADEVYLEGEAIRKDGSVMPFESISRPIVHNGQAARVVALWDLTRRKRYEARMHFTEAVMERMAGAVFWARPDGTLAYVNEAARRMTGYTSEELLTMRVADLIAGSSAERWATYRDGMAKVGSTIFEGGLQRKDGTVCPIELRADWISFRSEHYACGIAYDISERRRQEKALAESEARYRELSTIDGLTGLFNSRHFYAQLQAEIDRADRYGESLSLIMLDVDDFKKFNDTYGHVEGDQVLARLGGVIRKSLRKTDSAYRYGGEEFTILLPVSRAGDCVVTADRIRTEFAKETFWPGPDNPVQMTVSVGLGERRPGEGMREFVHRVDRLMYCAKAGGKDQLCVEASAAGPPEAPR